MKYESTIFVETSKVDLIVKAFEPEQKNSPYDRSSYTVERSEKGVTFVIRSQDSTSLRATLNSITKLLTVHEKLA